MPAGPFASSAGVGRAEPKWAELNKVSGVCGHGIYTLIETGGRTVTEIYVSLTAIPVGLQMQFYASGNSMEGPLPSR